VCKSLGTCSFLTIDNLQLQVSTSVISLNEAEHIELFPNPAFDKVFFHYSGSKPVPVRLMNPVGQTVRTMSLAKGLNTMNVRDLSPGAYFLEMEEQRYKLIKL
ncbi:MAG: T9SS type A sorting domain-containing protein, partial [Chitinophagaceae bacterium]